MKARSISTTIVHALCLAFISSYSISTYAQDCECDFTISTAGTEWFFDGVAKGVKPGDKICFASGDRGSIELRNIHGAAGNPVILKNMCNGKTTFTSPGTRGNNIAVRNCSYIHFTGGNNPNEEYGLELVGAVMGISLIDRTTDVELDHLYIHDCGGVGIEANTKPTCDPLTWRGNFEFNNLYIHHNYLDNIGGEAFYVGNSHYVNGVTKNCNGSDITVYEHDMHNVEISYNIITDVQLDGIQVSAVLDNLVVHHNYVYNYATASKYGHQSGIQLGAGCHSLAYNNIVDTGTGYCFFDGGRGHAQYYNNICINGVSGFLKTSNPPFIREPNVFANNIILNARESGFHLYSDEGHLLLNNIMVSNVSNFNWIRLNSSNLPVTDRNNIKTNDINSVRFVDHPGKDFHLLPGSPAIDKGINLEKDYGISINFDLDNNARPETPNGLWDIGPYEYKPLGPTSNAGPDVSLVLPTSTTTLTGTGTSSTGILGYVWTKKSGGNATLSNANTANLTVSDLEEGVYVFQLEVTDANGSAFDEAVVTVLPVGFNQTPTANAGSDRTITLPVNSLTLNGVGTDPDGTIATYEWSKVSGPTATLANENTPNLGLTNLVEGVYVFQLMVTDDGGATATDQVSITVNPQAANQLPTVNGGQDRTIYLPADLVTLTATASDPDGTITTILWEKRTGPTATLTNQNTLVLTADNLVLGTYVFRITVTDDRGGSRFDEVTVRVLQANQSPTANAGPDRTITLPTNTIVLNGQGTDPDGSITSYQWTKVSGPAASMVNGNTVNLTVNGMGQGVYVFGLTVTDNNNATGYDEVRVTVNAAPVNNPPTVNAGADRSITLPTNTLTLTGTASDSDGSISTILWTKKNGPTVTMTNQNTLSVGLSGLSAGTYTFTLSVTDNSGAVASDDVIVTVLPNTVNQPPVANAGANQFITLPTNSTTLTGISSDPDGTVQSVAWTKVTGPSVTLGATNANTLALTNLVEGEYVFRFTVTDNLGATASDQVTISVGASNVAPVVNAGSDQTIILPVNSVTIVASASDPDGTIQSYLWSQESGNAVTLSGETTSTLAVSNMTAGTYEFQITVTDNSGASSVDLVTIYVETTDNQLPVVSVGTDRTIYLPTNTVVLNGSAQDSDGTITSVLWTQESGPSAILANENTITLTALDLVEGIYIFRLTAQDNEGGVAYSQLQVTVFSATTNQAPVANAGPNQIIKLPTTTVTLNGVGVDADGTITLYSWEKVSGPSVTLATPNSPSLKLTSLVVGVYTIRLTVVDNNGATGSSLVTVTVIPETVNQNPLANAGQNQTITLPTDNTNLVGSGFDPDGTIQSYAWSKIAGPAGGTIQSPTVALTSIVGLVEGTYSFRLTVTDDLGATGIDDVTITVSSGAGNQTPSANAGGNKSIILPTNSVNLFGSGFDPDGTITSYSWKKISGGTVTMTNSTTPTLSISNLQEGQYVFQLVVTDNLGATSDDLATITVNSQTTNIPPTVFAGGDKIIKLPQNSVTIVGTASDPDGQVTSYAWTQQQGTPAVLGPPSTTAIVNISTLSEGTYKFRLTVSDNTFASSFDEMTLQVIPSAANLAPIVDAGNDAAVYLPDNTLNLSGTATDDGSISTYLWTKVSGPTATIDTPSSLATSLSNLVEGIYVFRLTVVDNGNISSSDELTVTVFPPGVNKLPAVNAGEDQEITLPANSLSLTATASDSDGTIASTVWSKVSGGNATLTAESTLTLQLNDLLAGTYIFSFTATDNSGGVTSDNVRVIVHPVPPNQKPIVAAGASVVVTLPTNQIQLTGTATDSDGTIANVIWAQQSGPGTATLTDASTLSLTASDLVAGTYVFRLSAADNEGLVGYSDAVVLVVAESADLQAPIAYAGADLTLTLPDNEIEVTGEGLDPDGYIENYIWEQVAGQSTNYSFSENMLHAFGLQPGSYTFKLTVIDTDSLMGFDELVINVIEETEEIPVFFSPNNDGPGDYWQFRNIDSYEQCSLVVFTRSGQEVYTAKPYKNDWDGTFNGKPLNDGDYYYIINCDDGRQLKGAVRIIR